MWPFDNNNQTYQQYGQAYDTGSYNNIDPNEAANNLQQFVQNAPPDLQQQIFQQHFGQMPYDQRMALAQHMPQHYNVDPNNPFSLAQGFMRLGREQPNVLQRIFSHPVLATGMIGLTALVAKHMIDNHERHAQQYGQQAVYGQNYNNAPYGGGGYNQGGYNQGGYNQGNPSMQQELQEERREVQELRREERQEERREERLEEELDGERPRHHHRREDY